MTPEELIAEQDATITQLRAEIERLEREIEDIDASGDESEDDSYWERVYSRIFDAWGRFALAELGTARPSVTDLEGRPELADLYETIR